MPFNYKLFSTALATSISLYGCQTINPANITRKATPEKVKRISPESTPTPAKPATPPLTPIKQKDPELTLSIKGDESLLPFSTKQTKKVCLNKLNVLKSIITFPSALTTAQKQKLEALNLRTKDNQVFLTSSVENIQALIGGFKFKVPFSGEGKIKIQTQLLDENNQSMGSLSYELQANKSSSDIQVLFKSASQKPTPSGCLQLSASIGGATLTSTDGGVILPGAPLPKPIPEPTPSVNIPAKQPEPEVSPDSVPITENESFLPPTHLRVVSRSSHDLTIDWQFPAKFTKHSYAIFLDGKEIVKGINFNNYTFKDLNANTSYQIDVQAIYENGQSKPVRLNGSTTSQGRTGVGNYGGGGAGGLPPTSTASSTSSIPTITSLDTSSGAVGSTVTLTGTNYSATTTNNTVLFGITPATVTGATTTTLTVTVPTISLGATTITVTTGGQTSTTSNFTVTAPPQSGEFQVNTFTTNRQSEQHMAFDNNGNFIVVWNSTGSFGDDSSDRSIQVRRFTSTGAPLETEFQANTYTAGKQTEAKVAADSNGNFVVTWTSYGSGGTDTSSSSIQAQRYNSAGVAQGSQFQVNTYTANKQQKPVVAMDGDGDFVIAWESNGSSSNDSSGYSIQAQRYNSSAVPQGTQFQVNTFTNSDQRQPGITTDSNGNFIIAWDSVGSPGSDSSSLSVQAQRYDSSAAPQGTQFQVNTYTNSNQNNPEIATDSNGNFVISWTSSGSGGSDTSSGSIQIQRYDSSGNPQGTEFQVNTYTTGNQFAADVAIDSNGNFVVSWNSYLQDGNSFGVFAQRYNSSAVPQGTEFQVNTYTTNLQGYSDVAFDSNGNFMISWNSFNGSGGDDNSNYSVQAQRYDSNGVAQ